MAVVIRLSVVINNYNYARFLAESIDSALSQLRNEDELVIVDDGSSDDSDEVLQRYHGRPGIRVIRQANQGQLAAMFNGLQAARGELMLLLDSDDRFLEGYLDRIRQRAADHPDAELFFSAARLGGDGTPAQIAGMQQLLDRMELEPGATGRTRWATLYAGEYVGAPTSGLALRRALVDRVLAARERIDDRLAIGPTACRLFGLPQESHIIQRLSGDGILVRAAGAVGGQKFYSPEPGFYYRIHGGNAYARIGRVGRMYLRLARSRQVAQLLRKAFDAPRPSVEEVVEEARGRSRPLRRKRRLRVVANYLYAVLRARGGPIARVGALARVPGAVLAAPQPPAKA
jgi:glycosyltransferase involved in cell wall biosynthesis